MKLYAVHAEVTISVFTYVKAKSEREAKRIADDRPMCTLHRTDQDDPDVEWSTSGELDGSPRKLTVEEREVCPECDHDLEDDNCDNCDEGRP